jgi:uncharacterized C2H2 Zn-finger protein
MVTYDCPRCGYETNYKSNYRTHLLRINKCTSILLDVSIESLIKDINIVKDLNSFKCDYCEKLFKSAQLKYQHKQRCKHKSIINKTDLLNINVPNNNVPNNNVPNNNVPNNQQLLLDLQYYKNRKNEKFYQLLLEKYLGGTHKTLSCGITDITTDSCHAEIKEWISWKEAIGQLTCYNVADPKENLEMYMFGRYKQSCKDEAIKIVTTCKINIYEFIEVDDGIEIISLINNELMYKYVPE